MTTAAEVSQTLDRLGQRKAAYQGIPQDVLDDLAGFCRAERTCWAADARLHALLEGRREVYLRIKEHLELTPEQLLSLYSNGELDVAMLKGTEYAR